LAATRLRPTFGLTLLLCAGVATAQPGAPPTYCQIAGRLLTVRAVGDTVPVKFANLIVLETHKGSMSDELGYFVLPHLQPGRVTLTISTFGRPKLVDTLDLVAGESVRRTYLLPKPRFDVVRDSLIALGQWPPPLDPALLDHMQKAHDVRVFRLDPDHREWGAAPDPKHRVAAWRIVHEAHRPSRHRIEQLIEAMRSRPYHLRGFEMYYDDWGGFQPDIDVRFTHDGVQVDVLLCYTCDAASIWRAGKWVQSGDLKDWRFFEFGLHAFPHDTALRKLTEPRIPH
jgi:hypothetical protein